MGVADISPQEVKYYLSSVPKIWGLNRKTFVSSKFIKVNRLPKSFRILVLAMASSVPSINSNIIEK